MTEERYPNQYRPIPQIIWGRIRSLWNLYRNGVGLEGEIEMELASKNLSPDRRAELLSLKTNRTANLEAWHDIARQFLEEGNKSK